MSDQAKNSALSSPLGKPATYCSTYAPELLFPIPRSEKRRELGLDESHLPFAGEDIWNAYELSWLNPKGKPIVAIGELRVPAHSPNLIESKSLKLYLNSFNQTNFDGLAQVQALIAKDLSRAAGAQTQVQLQIVGHTTRRSFDTPNGVCLDALDIEVDRYRAAPELLRNTGGVAENEVLYSHLLKSNCLVTGQPDWGMVAVRYSGPTIDREALLRYIISFRDHNEFHEQCVERIFTDITHRCRPTRLTVWARYTRRGGLDINPFRTSEHGVPIENVAEIRQ